MNSLGLKRAAIRFAEDRSGNFAVLFCMAMTAVMMAVGFGVNLTQAYHVKSSLHAALDAAVTSTARDITTGVIKKEDSRSAVEKLLSANSNGTFADKGVFVLDTLTMDETTKTLEATAHAYVDSAFPLFGYDPKVEITSAALYSDKKVEIAMMLDVTGSMAENWWRKTNKIKDLRDAASNAVGLVMKQNRDPDNPRVRVAIVPYADAVNIGELAEDVQFVEKEGGSDLPPPIGAPVLASAGPRPDNCVTERKRRNGKPDFTDDGPFTERINNEGKRYYAKVNRDDRLKREDNVRFCPVAEMVPLTADSEKLLAAIGEFRADGVTAGAIGVQWAYYMLSPEWRPAIKDAGLGAGPADYNKKKIAKVAILMTDGQFNTAFADVGKHDAVRIKQGSKSRSYAESLCKNMKDDGIEIYTIGFDLNAPDMNAEERDQAKSVLKNCSSPDTDNKIKHYFEASTGAELDAAFSEIILNTENLALIK